MAMAAVAATSGVVVAVAGTRAGMASTGGLGSVRSGVMGAPMRFVALKHTARRFNGPVVVSAQAPATETVDLEELLKKIKTLTLEDARWMCDTLQADLGISLSAYAPSAGGAGAAAPAEAAAAVEEKTEFDVELVEVPTSARIAVIKVVRTLTSLGLKEAKDLIEGLPKKVKEAVSKEDAEDAVKQLEGAGAKCSIK